MKLFLQFLYSIFIRISNCYSHIKCNIRSNIFDYTRIQQSFIEYLEKNIHPYLQLLVSMISSSTIQYIQGKAWWKYSKMEYHLSIDTSISKPLPVRPETIPHFGIHSKNLANHHQLPFFSARHHLSATVSVCLNWSTPIDRNPCSHSDKPVNLISVNPEMRARARARVCTYNTSVYTQVECVHRAGRTRVSIERATTLFFDSSNQAWILGPRVRGNEFDVHGHVSRIASRASVALSTSARI